MLDGGAVLLAYSLLLSTHSPPLLSLLLLLLFFMLSLSALCCWYLFVQGALPFVCVFFRYTNLFLFSSFLCACVHLSLPLLLQLLLHGIKFVAARGIFVALQFSIRFYF